MNLASNTAPVPSTLPSRVAAIQPRPGVLRGLWASVTTWPVVGIIPAAIKRLSGHAKLNKEVSREVLRFDLVRPSWRLASDSKGEG
jgi:hypothetical protein